MSENFDYDWFTPSKSYMAGVLAVRDQFFASSAGKNAISVGVYTQGNTSVDYFDYQDQLAGIQAALQVRRREEGEGGGGGGG